MVFPRPHTLIPLMLAMIVVGFDANSKAQSGLRITLVSAETKTEAQPVMVGFRQGVGGSSPVSQSVKPPAGQVWLIVRLKIESDTQPVKWTKSDVRFVHPTITEPIYGYWADFFLKPRVWQNATTDSMNMTSFEQEFGFLVATTLIKDGAVQFGNANPVNVAAALRNTK